MKPLHLHKESRKKTICHSEPMTQQEIENRRHEMMHSISLAAATVKLVCGVGNNAAWLVCLEAHDHAKQCKQYKNHSVRHEFKQALKMYHKYERRLIYADENRMFHVADMSPETRKKYGNITDREYFDFWTASGGEAYTNARPLLTSLWNKYRLSLLKHGTHDAEHVAWVCVAQAALELSVTLYKAATKDVVKAYNLPVKIVNTIFRQFSLEPLAKKWMSALKELSPDGMSHDPDPLDDKNIALGLEQLHDAWIHPTIFFDSTVKAVEEYDEIFRTKGEMKKASRELAEMRAETLAEMERE